MSRGPPSIEGMVSLKVDNLSYKTHPETLKTTFERYGEVGDVYIPRDRNYESRGFAFVRYYHRRDAEDAIKALDGEILEGRELRVHMAKYDRPANERRGPPRRYGGGGVQGRYGRSYSRSRSRSPYRRQRQRSYSRSRSRSQSPNRRRQSPSRSASPQRRASRSPSRSRSKS